MGYTKGGEGEREGKAGGGEEGEGRVREDGGDPLVYL